MNSKNVILTIVAVVLLAIIGGEGYVLYKENPSIIPAGKAEEDRPAMEFVLYNDDSGVVLDGDGNRMGGFTLSGGRSGMMIIRFASSMNFFGTQTEKVYLNSGYAYANFQDELDRNTSHAVAYEKKDEGAEVHFLFKSGKASANTSNIAAKNDKTSPSYWKVSNESELGKKIAGTIWTCRPAGSMWYRLVFKDNRMILYFAEPSTGKWVGGDADNTWAYNIVPTYDSYNGEKNISIQFRKPEGPSLSYGALFFNKDGSVNFQWLRGKFGGPAECKDFNWE